MNPDVPKLLSGGVACSGNLPFRWRPVQERNSGALVHLQESNEEILHLITTMDDHPLSYSEDHTENQELGRLDFKLNLLLDLVGQLVARHIELPPRKAIEMNASSIAWFDNQPPSVDERIEMEIFLSEKYPRPIILPGKVHTLEAAQTGFFVLAEFTDLSELVQQALEKIIFRQHRRYIAHSRRVSTHSHE